jgi:hypothetical protein
LASRWSAIQEVFAWVAKACKAYSEKPNSLLQRRKGGCACLFVGTREEAGLLPPCIGTHPEQAFHGLREQCIVQVASGLKMPAQTLGLLAVDL